MTTAIRTDKKSLDAPDETRTFARGKVDMVTVGGLTLGRSTFEPGWRWSESVKPIAGTDSCELTHRGVIESGRLRVRMDGGEEMEFGPGEAYVIAPHHDGWVVGDEAVVMYDVMLEDADYAKPAG